MGVMKTLARVRENFVWTSMKQDVHHFDDILSHVEKISVKHSRARFATTIISLTTIPANNKRKDS